MPLKINDNAGSPLIGRHKFQFGSQWLPNCRTAFFGFGSHWLPNLCSDIFRSRRRDFEGLEKAAHIAKIVLRVSASVLRREPRRKLLNEPFSIFRTLCVFLDILRNRSPDVPVKRNHREVRRCHRMILRFVNQRTNLRQHSDSRCGLCGRGFAAGGFHLCVR